VKVLLDTCVLSELNRRGGEAIVRAAVSAHAPEDVFLSVITVGEITKGVLRLPDGRKKAELTNWLLALDRDFAGRVLDIGRETVGIWGEISALAEARGRILRIADGLIAATAIQHGLRIYTRNVEDFAITGVLVTNPWIV
jgi:predicted nucleic acid-binding protein